MFVTHNYSPVETSIDLCLQFLRIWNPKVTQEFIPNTCMYSLPHFQELQHLDLHSLERVRGPYFCLSFGAQVLKEICSIAPFKAPVVEYSVHMTKMPVSSANVSHPH